MLEHVKTHNIETKNVLICSVCDYVLCEANELKVRNSLNQMEIHYDCVFASEICQYAKCNEKLLIIYDFYLNTILNHCDSKIKFLEILRIYYKVQNEDDYFLGDFSKKFV